MLGGARDEVVPRSQMQELWSIIRNRGRDTVNKNSPVGSAEGKAEGDEDEDEDDEEKEVKWKGKGKAEEDEDEDDEDEKAVAVAEKHEDEDDEDEKGKGKGKGKEKEDVQSGSSRPRLKPTPATGSGSGGRKVPRKIVDGWNIYVEFPDGMHRELCHLKSHLLLTTLVEMIRACSQGTGLQWQTL